MAEYSTVSEQIAYVLYKRQNPYPAQFGQTRSGHPWQGEIHCGHNPFLHARLADDLRVERGANGEEKARWKKRTRP